MIRMKKTIDKGWGVFATQPIEPGTLIECCPVFVFRVSLADAKSGLRDYLWEWGDEVAVATGFGSLYNHSYYPNAHHAKHLDLEEIHFHALRDISVGEEITINYGGFPTSQEAMWFTVK
jgi:SET domain-containing protein